MPRLHLHIYTQNGHQNVMNFGQKRKWRFYRTDVIDGTDIMKSVKVEAVERVESARHEVRKTYKLLNSEQAVREESCKKMQLVAEEIETIDKQYRYARNGILILTALIVALIFTMLGGGKALAAGILSAVVLVIFAVCNFIADQTSCKCTNNLVDKYISVVKALDETLGKLRQIRERNCPETAELLPNIRSRDQRRLVTRFLDCPDSVQINPGYKTIEKECGDRVRLWGFLGLVAFLFRDLSLDPADTAKEIRRSAKWIEQFDLLQERFNSVM